MTPLYPSDSREDTEDRRSGPFDRRLTKLEENYNTIMSQLNETAKTMREFEALRNQIQGMVNMIKFVGWSGFVGIVLVVGKMLMNGPKP